MAKDIGNLRTKLSFDKTGDSNLTDLSRDLKGIRSEMNNFRASGRAYRTSVEGMKKESDILSRRLEVQRERVAELKRRYDEARAVTGDNSAKTKDLAAQYNNANAQMKQTQQQLNRLNEVIRVQESGWTRLGQSMEVHGKRLQDFGRATTQFGKSYSMRVTTPILGAGTAALKVGFDFEEGMSKVQAISGATGSQLEKMSEQAKELGANTRFSATEAANGMEFLARAGWKTNEIMQGMPGLLNLAASSNMDLGRAADITSNIMAAFNIEAENAGYVADVLAESAANANTDVEQMGEAMKYLAPTSSTLGISMENSAAAIMAFSDAGIQGGMAGRAFGTSLTRLSKPTDAMQSLMDDLNVSFFDAQGAMKPLETIVEELEKGMSGYSKEQRSAALSTLFGSEAQRHWAILLDNGSNSLAKNTRMLEESEGAAERMADVMQDNAKGALTEFRSALEGAGIAASEHLIPAVTDIIKWATDLVRKFGELDDEQQKQILKWAGIVAAIGPASIALGQVSTVIGGVVRAGGSLARTLGRTGGVISGISALGMTGPVGLAVVGVSALAGGMYLLSRRSNNLNEVNWELVEGLKNSVTETDALIEQYEELELRNRLTKEETMRYMDILSELEQTTSAGAIESLSKEQEELLKKSGMTNDEMDEFLRLNREIIEKSPETARAISEQGNAYALNLDKLKELNERERERLMITAERELQKALENEADLLEEQKVLLSDIEQLTKDLSGNQEERKNNTELINKEQEKLVELERESLKLEEYSTIEGQRKYERKLDEVAEQQNLVNELEHEQERLDVIYEKILDKISKKEDDLDKTKEEIREVDNLKWEYESLILAQVDLTSERGKGLDLLEEEIDAIDSARRQLESKTDASLKGTRAFQDQVNELDRQKRRLQDAKLELERINDLAGRSVYDKQINIRTNPAMDSLNDILARPINKRIQLQGLDFSARAYAKGTDHHPGGQFIAGEEGWELGRLGNQWEILNAGLYDRPKGYEVFTHSQSKQIMNSLKNVPKYANGTNMSAETKRIVNMQSEPPQPIILEMHVTSEIDGRTAAKALERYVTDLQNLNKGMREKFA